MTDFEPSATVRLGQFLDLAGQWLGECHPGEASHRFCRTASLLLDIPYVAIRVGARGRPYHVVGTSRPENVALERADAGVLEAAIASQSPQLRAANGESVGVFPFRGAGGIEGCLHVSVERPLFSATEISFLRFLASLAGVMLAGGPASPSSGAVRAPQDRPERTAHADSSPPRRARKLASPVEEEQRNDAPAESAARRYVAMAVHDLRNPLNVVAGYAALLEEECLGAMTPEQREAVEAIGRQARVLHSAVDQLIDLDRMSSGDEVNASRFEVRPLFEDIRRTCFPDANGRVRWPGRESEFQFCSDRRRVYSIIQNLVDNALKHTAKDEVYVACERADGELVVLVCDHGPGLSRELSAKLVAQARTGAETAPRSGLGLYSVASHVHALGGAVDVEVAAAGGTAVRVCIPPARGATDTADREAADAASTPSSGGADVPGRNGPPTKAANATKAKASSESAVAAEPIEATASEAPVDIPADGAATASRRKPRRRSPRDVGSRT